MISNENLKDPKEKTDQEPDLKKACTLLDWNEIKSNISNKSEEADQALLFISSGDGTAKDILSIIENLLFYPLSQSSINEALLNLPRLKAKDSCFNAPSIEGSSTGF